jgi:cell wall-associated NlpC family hydrolase
MNYYENALKFEGTPYKSGGMDKNGIDCSGLVNAATGQKTRVWSTSMGAPPGNWTRVCAPATSIDDFLTQVRQGDLFLWNGHCAFYADENKLFHARKAGTKCGFTSDLKIYWLKEKGYPTAWRQI